MSIDRSTKFVQMRSLVRQGELELSLAEVSIPELADNEVLVRVDAAPINPSDLGLLFGAADMSTAKQSGTSSRPILTARVPEAAMKAMSGRLDASMPVGNEGAGEVVEAGSSKAAQALIGKKIAAIGGAMYGQYRAVAADQVLVLNDDTTAAEGASALINPLTVLGMIDTLHREGHTALVHTAAASNVGQMLVRACIKDGIPLVNVVRRKEQGALLRELGATHIVDQASPTFMADLVEAVAETKATLGFDATGGGKLPGQILSAMETALNKNAKSYSRYGSSTHKQVYIYGSLDTSPTELTRNYGMAWGMGGWLVFPYMQKIGIEAANLMKSRVAAELKTIFATSYAKQISLAEALQLASVEAYGKRATGEKYLVLPQKDLV